MRRHDAPLRAARYARERSQIKPATCNADRLRRRHETRVIERGVRDARAFQAYIESLVRRCGDYGY